MGIAGIPIGDWFVFILLIDMSPFPGKVVNFLKLGFTYEFDFS